MDNISLIYINQKRVRNISLSKISFKIDRDLYISLNYSEKMFVQGLCGYFCK